MTTYHEPRAGSIAMGTICATLAGLVLVQSALHTGFTIDHVLSVGALVITIAAGEMAIKNARRFRLIRAAGLALVFTAGCGYTIVSTAGRTAEQQQQAQATADSHAAAKARLEAERARILTLRGKAEDMLADAQRQHAKECASGRGGRCRGIKATIEVYEAAVNGRGADLAGIDRQLTGLGGDVPANGKLVAFAGLIEAVAGYPADATVKRLTVAWPYVLPLMLEVGSIIFWSIGLGGPRQPRPAPAAPAVEAPAPAPTRPTPTPPKGTGRRGRKSDPTVVSFVDAFREKTGRDPKVSEMQAAFPGMAKSTAHDYARRTAISRIRRVA